jgi:hypothetical protein
MGKGVTAPICNFTHKQGCYAPAANGDHVTCPCSCHTRAYGFRCKECGREYTLVQNVDPGTMVCHDCGTGREISWWCKTPVRKEESP